MKAAIRRSSGSRNIGSFVNYTDGFIYLIVSVGNPGKAEIKLAKRYGHTIFCEDGGEVGNRVYMTEWIFSGVESSLASKRQRCQALKIQFSTSADRHRNQEAHP